MGEASKNPMARYLAAFRERAPQTAMVIAAMTALHGAPAQASESWDPMRLLAARVPAVREVSPQAFDHLLQPAGGSQLCFGPVRATGDRAESLLYDRRLGLLVWLDRNGLPTDAPRDFKADAPLHLVGEVKSADDLASSVTYLFADRQRSAGMMQTLQFTQARLAALDLATAPSVRVSPFAGCTRADVVAAGASHNVEVGRVRAAGSEVGRAIESEATWRVQAAGRRAIDRIADKVEHAVIKPLLP